MKFMACSLAIFSVMPGLVPGIHVWSWLREKTWMARSSPAMQQQTFLRPRHVELRLLPGAVAAPRAVFAEGVGALKDPVLPGREAREYFRFHGLRTDEAQIGFHAGEAVGRERGAFLEEHPHLVVPIDIVEREGDEAELFGFLGIERRADGGFRAVQIGRIGLETRLQPGQAVAHRIRAK